MLLLYSIRDYSEIIELCILIYFEKRKEPLQWRLKLRVNARQQIYVGLCYVIL
jgi:hypothetical protein